MTKIKLEIDCAPRTARPDFHFKNIQTMFQESDFNNQIKDLVINKWSLSLPVSKSFGSWVWELESLQDSSKNKLIMNNILEYLKKIYHEGYIRYGLVDTL